MPSKPPFFAQGRSDTCAIACLRMVLAQNGVTISEVDLVRAARFQAGGIDIEDLAALVERFGLRAEIAQLSFAEVSALLARGEFPIVLLNRYSFDGEFAVHSVIPTRVTRRFVAFHDPLRGPRRVSVRKFEAARRWLARWSIVCHPR